METPEAVLAALVAEGAASAAVAAIGGPEGPIMVTAHGRERRESAQSARPGTIFDLASLTKPFMATLALALDRVGRLALETTVGEIWPGAAPALANRTLEDLLRHRAGLAAWAPLYALCSEAAEAPELLLEGRWTGAKTGTYSDLGFMLWAFSAERALGQGLWDLVRTHVLEPLGVESVLASPGDRPKVAACELSTAKEVELAAALGLGITDLGPPAIGHVQDGNARFLGGFAGHAGLFANAEAALALGREWLAPERLLRPEQVAAALAGEGPYTLGWTRPCRSGSAGAPLGPGSFGHTGFTGTSLWLDRDRNLAFVLLAHRTRALQDFTAWRQRFHAAATANQVAGT